MKRATLLLGLLLALTGSIVGSATAADAAATGTVRLQALDSQILTRLNTTRAAHGLRPLVVSDGLENAAVAHSTALLKAGVFQHDSPDGTSFVTRLKHFYSPSGYASWTAGENILYNTANIDADTAIQAWLDSPPHRQNMLNPDWREVGIGSVHADSAGGTYGGGSTWVITMDFGARTGGSAADNSGAKPAVTLKAVAAHKTTTKVAKKAKQARKTVATTHAQKQPQATATQKDKQAHNQKINHKVEHKAKTQPKPADPGSIDRVLPVPAATAPYVPPTHDSATPDPVGDAFDAAALRHRGDDAEDAGDSAGDAALDPLPPAPES